MQQHQDSCVGVYCYPDPKTDAHLLLNHEQLDCEAATMVHDPDKFTKCRVYDSQLSCEPGFASTGHSAQGKTLPKIACALNEGRFTAYIAASKATPQEGLAILQPVTLENLTHRLPSDLNDMKS